MFKKRNSSHEQVKPVAEKSLSDTVVRYAMERQSRRGFMSWAGKLSLGAVAAIMGLKVGQEDTAKAASCFIGGCEGPCVLGRSECYSQPCEVGCACDCASPCRARLGILFFIETCGCPSC
jgi:hypothetical protein